MKSTVSVSFRTEGNKPVTVLELAEFLTGVPDGGASATPIPITYDVGNQRDPRHVLVGMRVEWEEER